MPWKAKLQPWATTIFALFVTGITIFFAGEPLAIRASTNGQQNIRQICQLVRSSEENALLVVGAGIPNKLTTLLNGNNGFMQYGLLCQQLVILPNTTPCIEVSLTKCVPIGTRILSRRPSNSSSSTSSNPSSASPSPTPATLPTGGTTSSHANSPVSVGCKPQSHSQLACTVTMPSTNTLTVTTSNGPVSCSLHDKQLICNGSGLSSVLQILLGATLPPNATVSCGKQNNHMICKTGDSDPDPLVSCTSPNGHATCTATIPSNIAMPLTLPLKAVTCARANNQIACTSSNSSNGKNGHKMTNQHAANRHAANQHAANPQFINAFCVLGDKGQGNALLLASSEIHDPLKSLLQDEKGTPNYSLNCYNV